MTLGLVACGMVDWHRSDTVDLSNLQSMRVGLASFLMLFAFLWAVWVLSLLANSALERCLAHGRQQRRNIQMAADLV